MISSVALPSQQARGAGDSIDAAALPATDSTSQVVKLTRPQREYLDALTAAGIRPGSEIRALSIGSYVCQARAAGQSDQSVWESVAPMVHSDVADVQASSPQFPTAVGWADTAVRDYIRIATQRLC